MDESYNSYPLQQTFNIVAGFQQATICAHSFHVAICGVFGFVCLLVAMSIIKILSFFFEKESLKL
jgi:hypothetical protein